MCDYKNRPPLIYPPPMWEPFLHHITRRHHCPEWNFRCLQVHTCESMSDVAQVSAWRKRRWNHVGNISTVVKQIIAKEMMDYCTYFNVQEHISITTPRYLNLQYFKVIIQFNILRWHAYMKTNEISCSEDWSNILSLSQSLSSPFFISPGTWHHAPLSWHFKQLRATSQADCVTQTLMWP